MESSEVHEKYRLSGGVKLKVCTFMLACISFAQLSYGQTEVTLDVDTVTAVAPSDPLLTPEPTQSTKSVNTPTPAPAPVPRATPIATPRAQNVSAPAPSVSLADRSTDNGLTSELVLSLYKSGLLELRKSPSRVSVGNDSIADIVILRSNQVHVLGKALGSTNVVFWDSFDRIFATVNIEVTHDLPSLKKKLFQMLPGENISVYSAQENLVLEGPVSSAANLDAAIKVAESYLPECINSGDGVEGDSNKESCTKAEVINLMSVAGSQQVMLEVKVAEMSRTFRRSWDPQLYFLDITDPSRYGVVTNGASFPDVIVENERIPFVDAGVPNGEQQIIGPVVDEFAPGVQSIADKGLIFSDLAGDTLFSAAIELSKQNGLAKILAEPNLTTLTGRAATFHSGGEFPIVTTTLQGTTVTYREYGVGVKFLPTILGNTINLDIEVEVSEIDDTRAQTVATTEGASGAFAFPFLTSRSITNTVELTNGQTLGIAGLIQDDVDEVFSKIPGIGDIPILGNLFRSQQYQSGQTELVIFVTPHLAKPISPDKIRLPTDSFVPPTDFEFYVLGRMESLQEAQPVNRRRNLDGGFDGVTFGHDL